MKAKNKKGTPEGAPLTHLKSTPPGKKIQGGLNEDTNH